MSAVPRSLVLKGAALAGVALLGALLVVLVAWSRGGGQEEVRAFTRAPIEAEAQLAPDTVLFGDTVRARVEVTLDETLVDPASVGVAADFRPWEIVGEPERTLRSAGATGYLRTTFVLRCLGAGCVLTGRAGSVDFGEAQVSYELRGDAVESGTADRDVLTAPWPTLVVYSRFIASNLGDTQPGAAAWRADFASLPAATYRIHPTALVALLLAGSMLAAAGVALLSYLAWPRREPEPEAEPESEPAPLLSPLEHALLLLEQSTQQNGAADRRRALELVAEELERAEWGDRDLADVARGLAWSEGVPPVEETSALAERVRSALPEIEGEPESEDARVV